MLQQSRPRKVVLWLAFWAMLLAVFVPLSHVAHGMGFMAQPNCGTKQTGNDLDNKAKTPAQQCPICQFAQHVANGFVPPPLAVISVIFVLCLLIWGFGSCLFLPHSVSGHHWARGPPLFV